MKISLTQEECLELVIEKLTNEFQGYEIRSEQFSTYGETFFELIKKENKNE